MTELQRELARKAFHLLSLVYLGAYLALGRARSLWAVGAMVVVSTMVEVVRLRTPALNARLLALFGSIPRAAEAHRMSGIVWTSLGCWLAIALFGHRPAVVTAAVLYLALGDAAAAVTGKRFGRTSLARWTGRPKSLEGSLACMGACLLLGWAAGVRGPALAAGALAATLIELFPPPPDDNLWMPVGSGLVLLLFGA